MRRVPHTKCKGGLDLDKGSRHSCPSYVSPKGGFFWATVAVLPFGLAALAAIWWTRRRASGGKYGRIRLPEPGEAGRSPAVDFLVSIPWFVVGVVGAVVEKLREVEVPFLSDRLRARRGSRGLGGGAGGGYRSLRLDDSLDAELLGDYDDEL